VCNALTANACSQKARDISLINKIKKATYCMVRFFLLGKQTALSGFLKKSTAVDFRKSVPGGKLSMQNSKKILVFEKFYGFLTYIWTQT
jgi:hypothetical protein